MKTITALLLLLACAQASAGVTEWTPFDVENGHIFFDVTLDGVPARALLDSGAQGNAVSTTFLESNGIGSTRGSKITLIGVNGEIHTNLVNNVQLGIFGAEIEVDDLMPFEGGPEAFVVGLPFFDKFVVQIDYPGKRMRFITHDAIDMKKYGNVDMKRAGNSVQPMVRVDLNGEDKPWLIFDTGNNGGIYIQRMRAEELGWLERYPIETTYATGFTGKTAGFEVLTLPMMKIGPFTLENVEVMVPEEGGTINLQKWQPGEEVTYSKIRKNKPADGFLGYDVLQHFIVTIDFKRKELNLDVPR